MPRRVTLVTMLEKKNSIEFHDGEAKLTFTVSDAFAEWLESAIVNATPSDFDSFSGDEHGMNADGVIVQVHPEGM